MYKIKAVRGTVSLTTGLLIVGALFAAAFVFAAMSQKK